MFVVFIFLLGLFIGSFLGVLVDRIPRGETVIKGHSYCEFCKKKLAWNDLIPLLSFILLKGKCGYCKHSLSFFYPTIEISTGILFAVTYIFTISNFKFLISNQIPNPNSLIINPLSLITVVYYLAIVSVFIVIFFTDLKYGIIPDRILLPTIIVAFMYLLFINPSSLIINLLCGTGAFLFFLIISIIFSTLAKKEAMGGGDIKLAFFLGLFLGFPNIIVCLYIAFLTGATCGIILVIWKKKSFQKAILPFGTFFIFAALVSLFWGNAIIQTVAPLLGL